MYNKGKSMIRIPTSVIMGETIDSQEGFGLYALLKSKLQGNSNSVEMTGRALAEEVGIKDTRTMKVKLKELTDSGVLELNRSYWANANIGFTLNLMEGEPFTQVDSITFHRIVLYSKASISRGLIRNRAGYALRLYYYLAHRFNPEYHRAFPSYNKIREDTGMSFSMISNMLGLLEEIGVLKITRGRMLTMGDGSVDGGNWKKESNSYMPLAAESVYKDLFDNDSMEFVDIVKLQEEYTNRKSS